MLVILVSLGTATVLRNRLWSEPIRLWKDVVAKSPLNYRGLSNLGLERQNSHETSLVDRGRHYSP